MDQHLKFTPLHESHVALGAKMVPFGGWDMPLEYAGLEAEHHAVRNRCGVFDVSHMGEVTVKGPDAMKFVNHIFTNDVGTMAPGAILYGMMLNASGTVADDLLVYKRAENDWLLVINASNTPKDVALILAAAAAFDVEVQDISDTMGQLAVQGPEAEAIMKKVLGIDGADLEFYHFKDTLYDGVPVIVSRTGYTGEDGFELYAPAQTTVAMWQKLISSGECSPCGLGCRDTLRFEAGLPLYGDELDDTTTPLEAGLGIFVKLDKDEFIGREALAAQKAAGVKRKLVGLELLGPGIARHGYEVLDNDGNQIGVVTTGYLSPTLGKAVAMAYVDAAHALRGTRLQVQIRRRTVAAEVVPKRFYTPRYKK